MNIPNDQPIEKLEEALRALLGPRIKVTHLDLSMISSTSQRMDFVIKGWTIGESK